MPSIKNVVRGVVTPFGFPLFFLPNYFSMDRGEDDGSEDDSEMSGTFGSKRVNDFRLEDGFATDADRLREDWTNVGNYIINAFDE